MIFKNKCVYSNLRGQLAEIVRCWQDLVGTCRWVRMLFRQPRFLILKTVEYGILITAEGEGGNEVLNIFVPILVGYTLFYRAHLGLSKYSNPLSEALFTGPPTVGCKKALFPTLSRFHVREAWRQLQHYNILASSLLYRDSKVVAISSVYSPRSDSAYLEDDNERSWLENSFLQNPILDSSQCTHCLRGAVPTLLRLCPAGDI